MADMNCYLVYRKLSSKWLSVTGTQNKSPSFRRMASVLGKGHFFYFKKPSAFTYFLWKRRALLLCQWTSPCTERCGKRQPLLVS